MRILEDMKFYGYELGKWYKAYGNTIQLIEIVKEDRSDKVKVFCPAQNRSFTLYVLEGWKPALGPSNKDNAFALERLETL